MWELIGALLFIAVIVVCVKNYLEVGR